MAFTARQTDRTPEDDPAHEAKYVNSPETPVFTKGNLLFNLDRARTAVAEGKPFVLVEGQLDALRQSPHLEAIFGQIQPIDTTTTADQEVAWRSFTAQDGWHLDTLLIRRQAFQRIGPFDPAWMIDTVEWLWRARRLGLCAQVLPQVVAWRRIHGDNHSIRARPRAHAEYFRLIRLARAQQQESR